MLIALLLACFQWEDPDGTGVSISPSAGEYDSCQDLGIRNDTEQALTCAAVETDDCPSLGPVGPLEPGEIWAQTGVCCTGLSVACLGEPEQELRSWSWSIHAH